MLRSVWAAACCIIMTVALPGPILAQQPEPEKVLQEKEERPAPTEVERGGLLLKHLKFEIEPSLTYSHISENQIFIEGVAILPVLVVGEIGVQRIRRDLLIGALTGRIGITDDLQVEATVPYRYEHGRYSRPELAPPFEETVSDSDIGDVSGGLFFQPLREKVILPNVILGASGKTRTGRDVFEIEFDPANNIPLEAATGSGFYSLKGSVTFSKTSDPALLFATAGYTHNFSRDDVWVKNTGAVIDVDPGDTIEYGVGIAFALSPKVSLNSQFQQAFTLSTEVDGVEVVNSYLSVATYRIGTVWAITKHLRLDLSVGIGLTRDSPDVVVDFRLPFSF